jgi:hypothetical protein
MGGRLTLTGPDQSNSETAILWTRSGSHRGVLLAIVLGTLAVSAIASAIASAIVGVGVGVELGGAAATESGVLVKPAPLGSDLHRSPLVAE